MEKKQQEQRQLIFNIPEGAKGKVNRKVDKEDDKPYAPYASFEELYFSWYLEELEAVGYITAWAYEPFVYRVTPVQRYTVDEQLKTRVNHKRLSLFRSHEYTPDFGIVWADKSYQVLFNFIGDGVNLKTAPFISNYDRVEGGAYSVIEVKPVFDRNNMIRLFRLNQKFIYADRKIYIQEVVPARLFEGSFTPEKYLLTPTGKKKKLKYKPTALYDFIQARK